MPLRILCPQGHALVVSQARAGSTLCCPRCGALVSVPGEPAHQVHAVAVQLREPEPPPIQRPAAAVSEAIVEPLPVWTPPPKSRAIVEPEPRPAEPPAALSPAAQPPRQADPPPSPPAPVPPPALAETEPYPAAPAAPAPLESFLVAQPVASEPAPPALEPARLPREPEPLPPPLPTSVKSPAPTAARPPTNRQWLVAHILAAALAAAALFAAAPAAWDVVLYARAEEGALVSRWALAAIALAAVQLAYAAYLAQLPDWSSGWIVTLWSLAAAAVYAGLLGLTLIAGPESRLIQFLDLAEVLPTGRASMWCLCMTTIMASLAFFAGRTSLRWRQAL